MGRMGKKNRRKKKKEKPIACRRLLEARTWGNEEGMEGKKGKKENKEKRRKKSLVGKVSNLRVNYCHNF